MTFYVYRQNNSGGYFVKDENVSIHVIVEADTEEQANEKFDEILDGDSQYTTYCPCCGERWYGVDEVYETVEISDSLVEELKRHRFYDEAILYAADGTKKKLPWLVYGMYEYLQ
jgi:hypothetical protein